MARFQLASVLVVLVMVSSSIAVGLPSMNEMQEDLQAIRGEWPGSIRGVAAGSSPGLVRLKAGTFDPLVDDLPRVGDRIADASPGIYLVQYVRPVSPKDGRLLQALGVEVLGFVPDSSLAVKLPRPSAAIALAKLDGVRWLGPWQVGWKMHPALEGAEGRVFLTVLSWGAGIDASEDLDKVGANVQSRLMDDHIVEADASIIDDIAMLDDVSWIEPYLFPTFYLDNAARSIGARQELDGSFDPQGLVLWSYNETSDDYEGLTGLSAAVTVTDTGLDGGHPAFFNVKGVWTSIDPQMPSWSDPDGHGTNVAGIICGDGSYRSTEDPGLPDGKYSGIAPKARLNVQSLTGPGIFFHYRNLTKWSVERGSDISHNSWGASNISLWGDYTLTSREYDNASRDADWDTDGNQSILVVFAVGNDGRSGNNTVDTTAAAKNVIAVGTVGNSKQFISPDEVAQSSSRGPTDDGRIKPDLVAPGDLVTSTFAIADDGSGGVLPADGGTHSYISKGGSSMAAPVVTGSAALVIDYLQTVEGRQNPSPALIKSTLIASADHLTTVEWPGKEQGWGRVNVSKALVGTRTRNTNWIDQEHKFMANGESTTYKFDVGSDEPLSLALVWTDVSSAVYTGKTLVNDLDLRVRSPSGQVYLGNVFAAGESTTGGSHDRVNNVEVLYLDRPESGEWEVTVTAHELPPVPNGGNQNFALAVTGQVNKKFVDLMATNLTARTEDLEEGEVIPIRVDIANIGTLPASAVAYQVRILDEHNAVHETIKTGTAPTILPNTHERIDTEWTAQRGQWRIVAVPNPFRSILEESYLNNNASKSFFVKGYGLNAVIREPSKAGQPGVEVTYRINVTNEGNIQDRFVLDRQEPPSGWSARLSPTYVEVKPGEKGSVDLIVGISDDATASETARINVTITSQANATYTMQLSTTTLVLPVYRVDLDIQPRSQRAEPGETKTYEFTIFNLGNGPDTFRVDYLQDGGPTNGVTFTLPRATFSLEKGGQISGNFSVALDLAKIQLLTADETIAFRVRVFSVNDAGAGDAELGSLIIDQLNALTFQDPKPDGASLAPGDPIPFDVEIFNGGNGVDQGSIELDLPDGWTFTVQPSSFSLEVDGITTVQVIVSSPITAEGRTHNVTFNVKASDGSITDSFVVRLDVDWIPGIKVTLEGNYSREMTQESEISFVFRVTNMGNGPDDVTVEFGPLVRGLRAEARPISVNLGIGDIRTVEVVFNASADAELRQGAYDIIFRFAEDMWSLTVPVNITTLLKSGGPTNGGNGDDDDEGTSLLAYLGLAIGIVVALVVVVFLMSKKRVSVKREEETFFVSKGEKQTASVLADERATHREEPETRRPLPRPPSLDEPPAAPPAVIPEAAPAAPGAPPKCTECGSTMQPLSPPETGFYCAMCGTRVGGSAPGKSEWIEE
jgi:uncharacterized membrane protein